MNSFLKKNYNTIFIILAIIILIFYILNNKIIINFTNKKQIVNKKKTIKLDVIHLKTNIEKAKGLMFVKKMDFNIGALFEYNKLDKHCVWMKNTFIPLEIIYLNENFEIVQLIKDMIPFDLETKCNEKPAMYFIEVNKGFINNKKIKIGDILIPNIINS